MLVRETERHSCETDADVLEGCRPHCATQAPSTSRNVAINSVADVLEIDITGSLV